MPPPKSKVWNHFVKIDKELVKCKLCLKTFKSANNTSNMRQHLNLKHNNATLDEDSDTVKASCSSTQTTTAEVAVNASSSTVIISASTLPPSPPSTPVPEIDNHAEQPTIMKAFSKMQSYKAGGSKNKKLTQAVIKMIIVDNLPFSFVEGEGFKNLMREHSPLYKVPTRNTVKSHIDKLYETEVKKFVESLKDVPYLSLTSDIWTDSQMKSMIGVTAHGLLNNSMFSATIGVFEMTESHTAAYISNVLAQVLKDFDINSDKIVAFVTDNGANIMKAIETKFGKNKHVPCFAHTLNLVCEKSLDVPEVKELIVKCRNIVTWMKRHVNANDDLRKKQANSGVPEGKMLKLILDVRTRWNSCFYMLERLIKLLPYISQIMINHVDAPSMISSREREDVIEIISILRPLEAMTSQISGEKYATLSQVIPLVHCGREQLNKIECRYETSKKLKEKLISEFERRFGQVERSFLLAASTILDPRFKKLHFNDPVAISSVLKKLRNEMDNYNIEENPDISSETSGSGSGSGDEFDLWAPHKILVHKKRKRVSDSTPNVPQDELSFFVNASLIGLKQDPIEAWEEMKSIYPKLYHIARKYYPLIGTSVPSERLFSKAGATATEKRNRLTTKRLSKLLFLNTWLKKK